MNIKTAKKINMCLAQLENMPNESAYKMIKHLYELDKKSLKWFIIKVQNHKSSGNPSYEYSLSETSSWEEAEKLLGQGISYIGNTDFWYPQYVAIPKEEVIKMNLEKLKESKFRMGLKCPHDGSPLWWTVDKKNMFDVSPYKFKQRRTRTNSRISSKINRYLMR